MKPNFDKDKLFQEFIEKVRNAQAPACPAILKDERLEDAFKKPETDDEGYSESLPTIWEEYGYGQKKNGVLVITLKSASMASNLYAQYLDEEALVWDYNKERLLLYLPDPSQPKMAFKGSSWQFAKKLKPEFEGIFTLEEIYLANKCDGFKLVDFDDSL